MTMMMMPTEVARPWRPSIRCGAEPAGPTTSIAVAAARERRGRSLSLSARCSRRVPCDIRRRARRTAGRADCDTCPAAN
jgi:hypothetical protein